MSKENITEQSKTYLEMEKEDVEKRIAAYKEGTVSPKEKQQVKNLLDKIENRKLLPDFEIILEVNSSSGKIKVPLKLSDFLKKIKIEVPKETKDLIKKSEQRLKAIELLLTE